MITDITRSNIQDVQKILIEGSQDRNVIIFMYDSDEPKSEGLKAKLSLLAGNDSATSLVNVNLRETPELAQMLPVRDLPSLMVIRSGKLLGSLEGPGAYEPDEFVKKFLPKEDELLHSEARKLLEEGNLEGALDRVDRALASSGKDPVQYRLTRADVLIRLNRLDEAEGILQAMTMEDQLGGGDYYNTLQSTLSLARQALADSPVEELKKRLEQYNSLNQKTDALDLLLRVLRKDVSHQDAKKTYLDILETMGSSPVASAYRRKLYTLMY
mgnify:CR=1 FL=1